jgi:hypothetical protein
MNLEGAFVEREWLAVAPDGTERKLVLRVGNVSRQPSGDWAADVSLGDIEPRSHTIHGIDSWQAMHEGMRFAAARIKHFETEGWRFYFERGDEQASASDLFRGA